MPDFTAHLPLAAVTNPILLWLFKHGWEDPDWGCLPVNQVAIGLVPRGAAIGVCGTARCRYA